MGYGEGELNMIDWTLIFTATGAIASVISAIVAVRAKNKTQEKTQVIIKVLWLGIMMELLT